MLADLTLQVPEYGTWIYPLVTGILCIGAILAGLKLAFRAGKHFDARNEGGQGSASIFGCVAFSIVALASIILAICSGITAFDVSTGSLVPGPDNTKVVICGGTPATHCAGCDRTSLVPIREKDKDQ